MKVKAKREMTVAGFNIRTHTGRKSPMARIIKAGEIFTVHSEFVSNGMATHGDKCYRLIDGIRHLFVRACEFEVVG